MTRIGKSFEVEVLEAHRDWGVFRHSNTRAPIEGESYVKIPAREARRLNLKRGDRFTAYFDNEHPSMEIKASGNGPLENDLQYAKQFEGIGPGACKAFTPWFESMDVKVGDTIKVKFLSETEILFSKK